MLSFQESNHLQRKLSSRSVAEPEDGAYMRGGGPECVIIGIRNIFPNRGAPSREGSTISKPTKTPDINP